LLVNSVGSEDEVDVVALVCMMVKVESLMRLLAMLAAMLIVIEAMKSVLTE
jgi:hypothetical protein